MTTPFLAPLGTMVDINPEGASFLLMRPNAVVADAPVVVWNFDDITGLVAKCRGIVTEVNHNQASFRIVDSDIPEQWPEDIPILEKDDPVYLGLPNSFNPDIKAGLATNTEYQYMRDLAEEQKADSGRDPGYAAFVAAPQPGEINPPNDFDDFIPLDDH